MRMFSESKKRAGFSQCDAVIFLTQAHLDNTLVIAKYPNFAATKVLETLRVIPFMRKGLQKKAGAGPMRT